MSRAENVVEPKLTKLLNCFLSCKLANFADDIALFSDHQFQQAQDVLRNVEEASALVGLLPNAKKTKYMFSNHHVDPGLKTRGDRVIKPLENFKYLG